jgi:hypothetical protein
LPADDAATVEPLPLDPMKVMPMQPADSTLVPTHAQDATPTVLPPTTLSAPPSEPWAEEPK